MAGLLDEYPMPVSGTDPQELERLKYLTLMRMGMGIAGREPLGSAMQGGINTYVAGQENARRNADQRMQELQARMKYAQAARQEAQMQNWLNNFDPAQAYAAGISPAEVAYAKANPEHIPKLLEKMKPEVVSPGQMIRVPGIGFIDGVPDKDGMVNIIDPQTFQIIGRKKLAGQTLAVANEAAAVEAAQQAQRLQTIEGPQGKETRWGADTMGGPPAFRGQGPAPVAGQRPPPLFNFQNLKPEDAAAVLKDLQNPRPDVNAPSGNVIRGQDPMVVKRTEQGNAALLEMSKPIFEDQRKLFTAATALAKHVNNMEKLDDNGVYSGPAGFVWEKWGNAWNSAMPDFLPKELKVNPEKLANTQTFTAEVSKMQQALGKAFPGQQSNYELQVVTNALPQLILTPDGRKKIYATIRQAAEYEKANYQSMTKHAADNAGDLTGWTPLPLPEAPKELGGNQPNVQLKQPTATELGYAKNAIARNPAAKTAVIQRMRERGFDPSALEQ